MRNCIGVDLGGTQLRVAELDRAGKILWRASVPTMNMGDPRDVLEQIAALLSDFASHQIAGIAVAAPGPLDTDSGMVLRIPTLSGWENFPLRDALYRRFQIPVLIENDAIAAAVGEWKYGAGLNCKHIVYLTISTGIGGGIIDDRRVIRGQRGFAGHFGHMLLEPLSDVVCSCGRTGCFEAFASGTALDAIAAALVSEGKSTPGDHLVDIVGNAKPCAIHLAQAAENGHQPSQKAWQEQGRRLAQGIVTIAHALSPDVVVLGGSVSKSYSLFKTSLDAHLEDRLMPEFAHVKVVPAHRPDDAGILGAASLLMTSG